MKHIVFTVFILSLLFLSSCSQASSPTINPKVLVTPTPPPQPESGKASITGQVKHVDGYVISNTIIRLAVVARGAGGKGGAYILDLANSPGTVTDQNGYFNIQNIAAGEYVIVIGDVETSGIYEIIKSEDGTAKVWNFPADQVTDVGELIITVILPTPYPTAIPGVYPAPTAYPNP
jgi:hypothetical protein